MPSRRIGPTTAPECCSCQGTPSTTGTTSSSSRTTSFDGWSVAAPESGDHDIEKTSDQCERTSTRVENTPFTSVLPTATHAPDVEQSIPLSELAVAPGGSGVDSIAHPEPFHRSASVDSGSPFRLVDQSPTAVHISGVEQHTPNSSAMANPRGS